MGRAAFFLSAALIASVGACRFTDTYAVVENRTDLQLDSVYLTLSETPPRVIAVDPVEPRSRVRVRLPRGFGESSLTFRATAQGQDLHTDCGYLESDGLYLAEILVADQADATCTISLP